jgi:hypothetical protein
MKSQKYDLGQRPEPLVTQATDQAPSRIEYPCLSIGYPSEIELPDGEFDAVVTLRTKRKEWSESERGEKRMTYSFDVLSITPSEGSEEAEEPEVEEEEDAAAKIMKGMRGARSKKIAGEED